MDNFFYYYANNLKVSTIVGTFKKILNSSNSLRKLAMNLRICVTVRFAAIFLFLHVGGGPFFSLWRAFSPRGGLFLL